MTSRAHLRFVGIFFVAIIVALSVFSIARAASVFDITFPIPELGGCADRLACKAYCDNTTNRAACQHFAQEHRLAPARPQPQNDITGDDKMRVIKKDGGPGQCAVGTEKPIETCRLYCSDSAHVEECVQYGKTHQLFTADRLQKAQKVTAVLKRGMQLPQGCERPRDIAVIEKCTDFAVSAGLMTQEQADALRQKSEKKPMKDKDIRNRPDTEGLNGDPEHATSTRFVPRPGAPMQPPKDPRVRFNIPLPPRPTGTSSSTSFIGALQQLAAATFSTFYSGR